MAHKFRRPSIRRRFFLRNFATIVLPVVCVVLLLGALSIWQTYHATKETLHREEQQSVARLSESLGILFSEVDAQSLNYNVSPYIMLRLEAILQHGYADKTLLDSANLIKNNLDASVNAKPFIHSIAIYLDNPKQFFFVSGVGLANSENYRDIAWLQDYIQSPDEQQQWLAIREVGQYGLTRQQTTVISLFQKLYRAEQRKPIGLVVLNVREQSIVSFLNGQLTYRGQALVLTDAGQNILASAGTTHQEMPGDAIVFAQDIAEYGMRLTSYVPWQALYERIYSMASYVLLSVLAALTVGAVLAFFITRKNVRSITQIMNLIERAESGEALDQPVARNQDVYDIIMQNIVQGFAQRSALHAQLMEEKYTLQSMYFAFLQAQLNPHFLLNTLKNIFWMTVRMTGEPNEASEMIDLLTGLLHYALVQPNQYTTLQQEKEQTERYLRIQQIRFHNAITVFWEVDESILDTDCIKFILQPLVENSISHGLADKRGGMLRITLQRQNEEQLRISVWDNGHGMPEKRLAAIQEMLAGEMPPPTGIGLYNLHKRLLLTYGDIAGLQIQSKPEEGTLIAYVFSEKGIDDKK